MLWHLFEAFCLFCLAVVVLMFTLGPVAFFAVLFYRLVRLFTG